MGRCLNLRWGVTPQTRFFRFAVAFTEPIANKNGFYLGSARSNALSRRFVYTCPVPSRGRRAPQTPASAPRRDQSPERL